MNVEQILKNLVSFNSIFPSERGVAKWIENYLKKRDWKVKRQYVGNNRFNILAEKGKIGPSLVFYGHLDTVPVYGSWNSDPFKLTKKGDQLIGLGACDMKGGISAILASILAHTKNERKIKLIFGVDEENISLGAFSLLEKHKDWFSDVKAIYVTEPGTSNKEKGGESVLTLGRRGRVVYTIKIKGKSAHGATPSEGVNAISQATKIVRAVDSLKLPTHKNLGQATAFVRYFSGESTSLSVPENAILEIDRHLVVPETPESTLIQLKRLLEKLYRNGELDKRVPIPEVSIKKRNTPYLKPYVVDKDLEVVKKTRNIIRNLYGKIQVNYGLSVADENLFANELKIPVLTVGPKGDNVHQANEWVSKKSLSRLVKLLQEIIKKV